MSDYPSLAHGISTLGGTPIAGFVPDYLCFGYVRYGVNGDPIRERIHRAMDVACRSSFLCSRNTVLENEILNTPLGKVVLFSKAFCRSLDMDEYGPCG